MIHWEYHTLQIKVSQQRSLDEEKHHPWFSIVFPTPDVAEGTETELSSLGEQGWELVSVLPIDPGGVLTGTQYAIAFLKRPKP